MAIQDFIAAQQMRSLGVIHKYKLARALAFSVLQYHDTTWLPEELELSNVVVQAQVGDLPEEILVYLETDLPNNALRAAPIIPSRGKNGAETYCQRWVDYSGVHNRLLFRLGVALLEIGHWTALTKLKEQRDLQENQELHGQGDLREQRDLPNQQRLIEMATVRRVARETPSPLGKLYQDIVGKCLRCDFGCGDDFTRAKLQTAFYNAVICPLQDRIELIERYESAPVGTV